MKSNTELSTILSTIAHFDPAKEETYIVGILVRRGKDSYHPNPYDAHIPPELYVRLSPSWQSQCNTRKSSHREWCVR